MYRSLCPSRLDGGPRLASVRPSLDNELGLGTRAASMCAIGMSRELHRLIRGNCQDFFELSADILEDFLASLRGSSFPSCNVTVASTWDALSDRPRPHTNAEESLAYINNNSHHLSVVFLLEGLANGSKHHMKPHVVNRNAALVLELVRPFATVLVLDILPFWPYSFFEEMIVGLQSKLRGGSNIVLDISQKQNGIGERGHSYVDSPEFLH